jgi:probable rRNA maturation factor
VSANGAPIKLLLQIAVEPEAGIPAEERFAAWVSQTLVLSGSEFPPNACVTIRIVDADESSTLNSRYRDNSNPTNVLAFPAGEPAVQLPAGADGEDMEDMEDMELGDLVMCLDVVSREAAEQHKQLEAHFAHLAVHGTLHLVGYDHQADAEAEVMESLETRILETLGFDDPYNLIVANDSQP